MFRMLFPITNALSRTSVLTTLQTTFSASGSARLFSSFEPFDTKYTTKVVTPNNKEVNIAFSHYCNGTIQHKLLVHQHGEKKPIGDMEYFIWDDHIYIHHMHNTSQYRYIGTLLHEVAFRQSVLFGRNGFVRLSATGSSHYFHFLNGFRPAPTKTLVPSIQREQYVGLIEPQAAEYLANPNDPTAEKKLADFLNKNHLADTLKHNARMQLRRPYNASVSLREMLSHGLFQAKDPTPEWEEKFAAIPKGGKINTSSWGLYDMHYPAATIEQKKEQFGLTTSGPKPISATQPVASMRNKP